MPSYRVDQDITLTSGQRKRKGFADISSMLPASKKIKKGAFRNASNRTQHGYSSGYHEAGITTDTVDHLQQRAVNATTGISSFSSSAPKPLRSQTFLETNVEPVLYAGDGARTDTAQTILSVPTKDGGGAAGHSGSGVKTTKQAAAHDLLRETTVEMLQNPHLTDRAAAVTFGALSVASMAPGEVASTAQQAKQLKAKQVASEWEDRREEAKARVESLFQSLSPQEQQQVHQQMKNVFGKLPQQRQLTQQRCTSPARFTGKQGGNALSGGGYSSKAHVSRSPSTVFQPQSTDTNQQAREATLYMTQLFRGRR